MSEKTIKEYNKAIKMAVESAIDFQDVIEWHTSYVQNGKVIAPNIPDDSKEITRIQFSILLDRNLRDDVVNKIINIKIEDASFQLINTDMVCYEAKKPNDRNVYYYTAKIAVIKR